MASFCKECHQELFGEPGNDFEGLLTADEFADGLVATALCEDCGYIDVDHTGHCVCDCDKHHHLTPRVIAVE